MKTKGYIAKIEAEPGHLLLGGLAVHTTGAFEEKRHAQLAAAAIYKANKAAGKFVKTSSIAIFEVNYVEIKSYEVYEDEG